MSKIIEMKEGEYFEGFYLIKSAVVKTAKNGKEYLDFVFQDKTGEIGGKLWGATSKDIEQYHAGVVSFVAGTRSSYNGTPQLEKLSLRLPEGDEPTDPE
jgi:CMP-binding-factor 1